MPVRSKKKRGSYVTKIKNMILKRAFKLLKSPSIQALKRITGFDKWLPYLKKLKKNKLLMDLLKVVGKSFLESVVPQSIVTAYDIALDAADLYSTFNKLTTFNERYEFLKEAIKKYGFELLPKSIQNTILAMEKLKTLQDNSKGMDSKEIMDRIEKIAIEFGHDSIPGWMLDMGELLIKNYKNRPANSLRKTAGLKGKMQDNSNYAKNALAMVRNFN